MRRVVAALVLTCSCVGPTSLGAQRSDPLPSAVVFNLKQSFLAQLLTGGPGGDAVGATSASGTHSVGARFTISLRMGEHSPVHPLASDCELHVAGKPPRVIAYPAGLVAEPPNVCEGTLPALGRTDWSAYFTRHVTGKTCDVTGFPRIFTEHSEGGHAGTSNPNHVVEIHPATRIACGSEAPLDFVPLLHASPGLRKISDASTIACLDERKLYVRMRGPAADPRYEFSEEGAKGTGGTCGNFVVVDAHFGKEYLRELTNGGDHAALAEAWVGDKGPFPLKVYTYKGTSADDSIAALMADPDSSASLAMTLHGVLTYDYFTIAQTLQDEQFNWLPASALKDWTEIPHPISLVVFGREGERDRKRPR